MIRRITILVILASLVSISTSWTYESSSLECQGAYSEYCFNGPNSTDDYQTFDDAMLWCLNRSSQLAVISGSETQDAVSKFLDSWSSSSTNLVYINMKLRKANPTWYLINGSLFYGGIADQGNAAYKLYISLQFASTQPQGTWGSIYPAWWSFASRPEMLRHYICEFDGFSCPFMNSSFPYNDRCFAKYENDSVNWFEARKRCISEGGDLATFNYPYVPDYPNSNGWQPPFDTSTLNSSLSYWVGIRYNNLSWMSPADAQNESMFYNWSSGKPNNFDYSCVCLDKNAVTRWSWTDCDCSIPRPFLCLTRIQTTTPTTTTTTTTITTTATTAQSTTNAEMTKIISIAVGVGGGVIILVVVIIVIVCIITRKRRRERSRESEEKLANGVAGTGEYLDAEAIQGFAADNPEIVPDVAHPTEENGTEIPEVTGLYGEVIPGSEDSQDSIEKEGHEETNYDDLEFIKKNEDQNSIVKSRFQTIYSPDESSPVYENYAG